MAAPVSPYSTALRLEATAVACRAARTAEEIELHRAIRHQVFVVEQQVFPGSDADERDGHPGTIAVLGFVANVAAGAVRLYPLGGDGQWQGDRLAVLAPYRAHRLGGPLVRFAVESAARRGGLEMVAHVQLANVAFFERLGWECRGEVEIYVGLPHQLMTIDLTGVLRGRRPGPLAGPPPRQRAL
jgi:putative N-acetyltransferase (TIGR04045 family)